MNKTEIEQGLTQFYGTERYYKHWSSYVYTDGIKFLLENAKCYWLLDAIVDRIKKSNKVAINSNWLSITLTAANEEGDLHIEDGNNNTLDDYHIEYTDFPLDSIKIWLINGVFLLPSEY